ncbi:MAG TPA: SUMF1/EgtB/PvdO family nonheme iron enzyme, partial [Blastocatellia bacterium]|nr:SUMF1/EgtB/PvdO family nonheme iron enzyme [Blastocatellia bacterium]
FASELRRVVYSGTQIMGGVVTGQLAPPGEDRATVQWGGPQTRVDSRPPFTGQADSARPTAGAGRDPNTWSPTEVVPPPTAQHLRPEPTPQPISTPPAPVFAAPVTVRDLPPTALAEPIIAKPQRSGAKWVLLGGVLALAVIGAILFILLRPAASTSSGFVLVVKGAPAGSQVFINNVRREAASADGALRVSDIEPGEVKVRVSREGFTDYMTTLTGTQGEIQTCEARLLPPIDYRGPMVPISPGVFIMGDDSHEADEKPAHQVNLPAYYIDKHEVTNADYKKFCDETNRAYPPNPSFDNYYFTGKPDYPVLGVTFEDALAYASWAGKRLPTEPEWEKAASWDPVAQRKQVYPWGDQFTTDRANIGTGSPVAVNEATGDLSFYGVLNMAGNALEWVDAPYKPYDGNKIKDAAYDKDERVIRGGTFLTGSKSDEARTSFRNHLPRVFPRGMSISVGLRCVVSADDPNIQPILRARSQ